VDWVSQLSLCDLEQVLSMGKCKRTFGDSGFTLIELMIVVAIVAVLTLIAYPSYQSFVVKANRSQTKSYLMDLAQKQQMYFNDSRTYATKVELDATEPDKVSSNYVVTFAITTSTPPPKFKITAAPISGSQQGDDGELSIDNTGAKLHRTGPW
jgi:type IV pilus assembly protein PilE